MKFAAVLADVVRYLLGAMFLFSAAMKFVSIDAFEIYVFSYGIFSLGLCFYAARLLLVCELVLGVALIVGRCPRLESLFCILFLLAFEVFLAYASIIGRTDSCHCFGDILPFTPVQSIIKNAVLIPLALFVFHCSERERATFAWWLPVVVAFAASVITVFVIVRTSHVIDTYAMVLMGITTVLTFVLAIWGSKCKIVNVLLPLVPLVAVFVLSPPDNWFYRGSSEPFDKELFLAEITPSGNEYGKELPDLGAGENVLSDADLNVGRHVVAFFSPKCAYCQLAASKISSIVSRHNLDTNAIVYVFPKVDDDGLYDDFYKNSGAARMNEMKISKTLFLKITRGEFPLVVLVDDGTVEASYGYRNINEKRVADFVGVQ